MTFPFQEEIEEKAAKYAVGDSSDIRSFKAGAQALYELLLKDDGEFSEEAVESYLETFQSSSYYPGRIDCARWQHSQSQAQIVALKTELSEMNKNCISLFLHDQRVAALEAQLAKQDKAVEMALGYCKPFMDKMWAAMIVSILLDCDFRDSDSALKEYQESEGK